MIPEENDENEMIRNKKIKDETIEIKIQIKDEQIFEKILVPYNQP